MQSRKRIRSTECSFVGQTKHYIRQSMVDEHNAEKMNQIYNKTVLMLFKGCSNHFDKLKKTDDGADTNNNAGAVDPIKLDAAVPSVETNSLQCHSCMRKSQLETECQNCSLDMCEQCGFNCAECKVPLCLNCVNLFDCGTPDSPCCSRCKMYI